MTTFCVVYHDQTMEIDHSGDDTSHEEMNNNNNNNQNNIQFNSRWYKLHDAKLISVIKDIRGSRNNVIERGSLGKVMNNSIHFPSHNVLLKIKNPVGVVIILDVIK